MPHPKHANTSSEQNMKQSRLFFQYFLFACIFTFPFIVQILTRTFGYHFTLAPSLQLVLGTLVQFGAGWILYRLWFDNLKITWINLLSLILFCTTIAFIYNVIVISATEHLNGYFEIETMVITFTLCGKWIESFLKEQSMNSFTPKQESIFTMADRLSQVLLPIIVLSSLGTFFISIITGNSIMTALDRSAVLTIVACPAVLALAIPLTCYANGMDFSQHGIRKIRQNLFFSFAYHVLAIPLAALGVIDPFIATNIVIASFISFIANTLFTYYWHSK